MKNVCRAEECFAFFWFSNRRHLGLYLMKFRCIQRLFYTTALVLGVAVRLAHLMFLLVLHLTFATSN